jgi:hypothetical protein
MSYRSGKDCRVTLGANTVVGMGTWSISGITADQMDSSAFNDNWKSFEFGMKDGGTIEFSGLGDPDDVTGQEALEVANVNNSDLTTLRLYIDDTSYYVPNQTTGYFSPTNTTGMDTVKSHVNVTSYSVNADKADLLKISFTCKVSGNMAKV